MSAKAQRSKPDFLKITNVTSRMTSGSVLNTPMDRESYESVKTGTVASDPDRPVGDERWVVRAKQPRITREPCPRRVAGNHWRSAGLVGRKNAAKTGRQSRQVRDQRSWQFSNSTPPARKKRPFSPSRSSESDIVGCRHLVHRGRQRVHTG